MSELTEVADVLARGDEARAVVRVLDRHGFGTVEPGQLLVAGADGTLGGVLLRGALDDRADDAGPRRAAGPVGDRGARRRGRRRRRRARLRGRRDAARPPARRRARPARSPHAFAAGVPAALVSRADGSASLAITGGDLDDVEGSLGFAAVDAEAASRVPARCCGAAPPSPSA